ncbi:phBC6A51 family helix-turn-helix protein [Schinkia azotoformans]|uniref:phBC6A51 family helix-turn-helix protein n=1 Tax=Schinkia azotoformans TaxID=1454 RepID=UPI002DBFF7CD|nr:phBC6A51 family helix-turn-helix protein [Schinkia azotoformans]MEC1780065.1 phBC6A51 family helix-turn-helix protein [Schinkia azotoformans]MED4330856.1 phBC6A51 family helix-turn-helix protein [Schinkia azotoformans]
MLNDKQLLAIELIAEGEFTKTEIATKCNTSRQSIYNWLSSDEFITALDDRLQNRKKFVEKMFDGKLEFVIDKLYELAKDDSNKRVQAQVLQYLADRSLGKTPSKHEVMTEIKESKNYTDDQISEVFDQLEEDE